MLGYRRTPDGSLEIMPEEDEIVRMILQKFYSENHITKRKMTNEGQNYRRKTTATGIVWICATYNTKGKKYCPTAKQILENTLIDVCCEVLELQEFDVDTFENLIEKILVQSLNELIFVFTDEHQISAQWKDRSRSESWTYDMRKKAGERSRKSCPKEQ